MTGTLPFRVMYLGTLLTGLPLAVGAFLLSADSAVGWGVVSGLVIGLIPFASWNLAVHLFLKPGASRKQKVFIALISLFKFALLAAGLYFLVINGMVSHWGLFAGMLPPMTVCIVLGALHNPAAVTARNGEEAA